MHSFSHTVWKCSVKFTWNILFATSMRPRNANKKKLKNCQAKHSSSETDIAETGNLSQQQKRMKKKVEKKKSRAYCEFQEISVNLKRRWPNTVARCAVRCDSFNECEEKTRSTYMQSLFEWTSGTAIPTIYALQLTQSLMPLSVYICNLDRRSRFTYSTPHWNWQHNRVSADPSIRTSIFKRTQVIFVSRIRICRCFLCILSSGCIKIIME